MSKKNKDPFHYNDALSDFAKVIELDPNHAEAYYWRGDLYTMTGKFTESISDYTKAIKNNPKYAVAYHHRGYVYANVGNSEEAKKDLLKAIELDPSLKSQVKKLSDLFKLNLRLD